MTRGISLPAHPMIPAIASNSLEKKARGRLWKRVCYWRGRVCWNPGLLEGQPEPVATSQPTATSQPMATSQPVAQLPGGLLTGGGSPLVGFKLAGALVPSGAALPVSIPYLQRPSFSLGKHLGGLADARRRAWFVRVGTAGNRALESRASRRLTTRLNH